MAAPSDVTLPQGVRLARARACWVKAGPVTEGRGALRVPFDETVVVTPWEVSGGAPAGPSLLAAGRDLSSGGLSFSHAGTLPHRHVAVSFRGDRRDGEGRPVIETLLVRLIWCRFTRRGLYLSGGRLEGTLGETFGRPLAVLLEAAATVRETRAAGVGLKGGLGPGDGIPSLARQFSRHRFA